MSVLSVCIPVYDDYDGLYFTVQALRLYHDLAEVSITVVDGSPHGSHAVEQLTSDTNVRYLPAPWVRGVAAAKDVGIWAADADAVLCLDSHVLLYPGVFTRLKHYYLDNPDCKDLLQGPRIYDNGHIATHLDLVWAGRSFGAPAYDKRIETGKPFVIEMQAMQVFSVKKDSWPGYSPYFYGHGGGEEGYIHEKVRRRGGQCLCLPWFKWVHRPRRTKVGSPRAHLLDRITNYIIAWRELNLNEQIPINYFRNQIRPYEMAEVIATADSLYLNKRPTVSA